MSTVEYRDDIQLVSSSPDINWDFFSGKTIVISGATGMLGTFLIDVLLDRNTRYSLDCHIVALGRHEGKIRARFPYTERDDFSFEVCDVSQPGLQLSHTADIIFHLASATHPHAYSSDPIGTISSNVIGLSNLLDYAHYCDSSAFVFTSSVEIYGDNKNHLPSFAEDDLGYINCNTLRAGYPEAKRVGEALCQAYRMQYGLRPYIIRLPRLFGPTLLPNDSKAMSQFIRHAVRGENIVLKSEGHQYFSYLYLSDAVSGILYALTHGESGTAYNLADSSCDISLRDAASFLAAYAGTHLIFDIPDAHEQRGYSTATHAILNPDRIHTLGWKAHYSAQQALERTVNMLKGL